MLLEPTGKGGGKGEGFDVVRSGDARYYVVLELNTPEIILSPTTLCGSINRVALIGFPSVGKSTLLSKVTKTKSETASYEFSKSYVLSLLVALMSSSMKSTNLATLTCIPGL